MLPPSGVAADSAAARAAAAGGNAVITIVVPSRPSLSVQQRATRRPAYVSTATKGMTVAFLRGGKTVVNQTIALTPGSPNCKAVSKGTQCKLTIPLKACGANGNCYLANVSTYDAVKCKGKPSVCSIPSGAHELSIEQKYPVGISAGTTTHLALTLAGIPVRGKVVPADAVTQSKAGGFDLIGSGAHALAVEFLDADGEIISGAGAPSLKISAVSGGLAPVVVATPASSQNEIHVTPPGTFDGTNSASFTVAPSYAGQATNGCAARDANCSPVSVEVDMLQMAAISSRSGVQLYVLGATTPLATLQGGLSGLASDASGNLYTGDVIPSKPALPESLVVFSPPLTDGMAPTANLTGGQTGFALGLMAQVQNGGAFAQLYNSGTRSYSLQLCSSKRCVAPSSAGASGYAIAADAAGDTALAQWPYGCQIELYRSGSTTPSTIGLSPMQPCAQSMVYDGQGDVFLNLPGTNQVAEISPTSGVTTISTGTVIPYQIAVDATGNLLYSGQDSLTLAATLLETLSTTLAAHQGGSIAAPDRSIVIEAASSGEGTASEILSVSGGVAYVQYSFLNGSTGRFAAFSVPDLTQSGSTISNNATMPSGLVVSP
jgi:hypothetical protein